MKLKINLSKLKYANRQKAKEERENHKTQKISTKNEVRERPPSVNVDLDGINFTQKLTHDDFSIIVSKNNGTPYIRIKPETAIRFGISPVGEKMMLEQFLNKVFNK